MSPSGYYFSRNQLLYIYLVAVTPIVVALVVSRSSILGQASDFEAKITRWAAAFQRLEHDSERKVEDGRKNMTCKGVATKVHLSASSYA